MIVPKWRRGVGAYGQLPPDYLPLAARMNQNMDAVILALKSSIELPRDPFSARRQQQIETVDFMFFRLAWN